MKGYLISAGLGMAAGAAVILMFPPQSRVRRMADHAAESMADACDRMMH